MKTPISYYGGKQNLLYEIIPMIPLHIQYVEPFCGGASLFWAKSKSQHEVINDADLKISNFWNVLQNNFHELAGKIEGTLHMEYNHTKAKEILRRDPIDPIEYAWAFWVQTQMSFSFKLFGGFAFDSDSRSAPLTRRKREAFNSDFYNRIKDVEIFNRDAIDLIKTKDGPDTFMYLDPPYPEGNCGHYEDRKGVYYELIALLPQLQSKWLMSSYPSEELDTLRNTNGYFSKNITQNLGVSGKLTEGKSKVECLTWNYQIPQLNLFN